MPVLIDNNSYQNTTFRRISIIGNSIRRNREFRRAHAIPFGASSPPGVGHIFEDITIENNLIEYGPTLPLGPEDVVIAAQSSEASGFDFRRVVIRNNRVIGNGTGSYWTMDLRRLQDSVVEGNLVRGVTRGIAVLDAIRNTRIQENTVGASNVAYYFGISLGGNRFERNRYFGSPTSVLQTENLDPTDVIEQPTQVPPP